MLIKKLNQLFNLMAYAPRTNFAMIITQVRLPSFFFLLTQLWKSLIIDIILFYNNKLPREFISGLSLHIVKSPTIFTILGRFPLR